MIILVILLFKPKQIIFLKDSLKYEIGRNVFNYFTKDESVKIVVDDKNVIKNHFDMSNFLEYYKVGKRTLVLGVKKVGAFQSCRPSAHYQLPLVSGCMGQCEYCYLQTELAEKPYLKVNVNMEDILDKALDYMNERPNAITIFEGSATSDVLPIEPYTGILAKAINFFAKTPNGRFRFVTKFSDVDTLLKIDHNDHTEIRFSINTDKVIRKYEHSTSNIKARIDASKRVLDANYRVGFLIAPVIVYPNYQEEYYQLLVDLRDQIGMYADKVTFEVISHRFTPRAKKAILSVFPNSQLDMDEEKRTYRMGQFGYGKYLYTNQELKEMKNFFVTSISNVFPESKVLYII